MQHVGVFMESGGRLLVTLILATFLVACDFFESETLNRGTTKGYASCIEKIKKQHLSEENGKIFCGSRHEKEISVSPGGRAGFEKSFGSNIFSGSVENKSVDHIITGFDIIVNSKDKTNRDVHTIDGKWIEPSGVQRFIVQIKEFHFVPPDEKKDDFEWIISRIRGIKISL
jgi:hypothetical protein